MGVILDSSQGGQAAQPLSAPEHEWEDIAERTRTEYLHAFEEGMSMLTESQR